MDIDIQTMKPDERAAFWIKNLQAARTLMLSLHPGQVELDHWRHPCGTIFCFGGWLPTDAYFQSLGVTAEPMLGYPQLPNDEDRFEPYKVALVLFGEEALFFARDWLENEYEANSSHTDRDVVLHRIDARLRRLGEEN
ncbi:hypothetical protein [Variovorax paradoxus]|uniref:hypothetical protein n=1 Tax=Variovorax paradoxus TaxID=34073 RepID=UPI001931F0CF|nr:hypothetical protein INQ48_43625 [Variovorax paradoxus]